MSINYSRLELKRLLVQVVRMWAQNPLKTLWKTMFLCLGMIRTSLKRIKILKKEDVEVVPMGIGFSPTMRCNLSCKGCYSRLHTKDREMSMEEIDSVIGSAVETGVFFFMITGGEPYIRPEMMDIYRKYREKFFITVTNGTLIDENTVSQIAKMGNVFPMVSIEGTEEQTDARRGKGVHQKVLKCMSAFKKAGILFGFSAVLTDSTIETLGSDGFVAGMVSRGCVFGLYNDFIPITSEEMSFMPAAEQSRNFKKNLGRLRKKYPIILVHLPDDEYDENGRCTAVASCAVHINANGDVGPCPFAHFARENAKNCSFKDILKSPFLKAIRSHPTVLHQGEIGCSLVSNFAILEQIARETGAKNTNLTT